MKIQIDSISTRKNQITVFDGEKNIVIPKKDFSNYTDGAKFIPVSEWCDNLERLKITGKTEFPITFNQSQQDLARKSKNTIIFSDEKPYPKGEELFFTKRNIRFYIKDPSFNMDMIPYFATEVELDSSFTEFPYFFGKGGISTLIIPNTVRTDNNEYNFQHCQNLDTLIYKGTKEDLYNNTIFNNFSYFFKEIECEDGTAYKTVDLPIMSNEELSNFVIKPFERYILHLDNNNLINGQYPKINYYFEENIEKLVIEKDVVSFDFEGRTERLKELYISEGVKNINISCYNDKGLNSLKIIIPKSTETLTLDNTIFYNINYNGTISEFNSKFQLPFKVTVICSDGIIPIKEPIELQAMTLDELNAYQFLDTENYILHINNENIDRMSYSSVNVPRIYKIIIDEDVTEIQDDLYGLDAVELELPSTLLTPLGNICCGWESLEKINSKSNSDKFISLSYTRRRQYVEVTYNDGYTESLRFNAPPPPM